MLCAVCGEPAAEDASVLCNNCNQRFHLNQRNDREGKDCGEVWISEQYLALEFACRSCLNGESPQQAQAPPRVLRPRIGKRRYRRRA